MPLPSGQMKGQAGQRGAIAAASNLVCIPLGCAHGCYI